MLNDNLSNVIIQEENLKILREKAYSNIHLVDKTEEFGVDGFEALPEVLEWPIFNEFFVNHIHHCFDVWFPDQENYMPKASFQNMFCYLYALLCDSKANASYVEGRISRYPSILRTNMKEDMSMNDLLRVSGISTPEEFERDIDIIVSEMDDNKNMDRYETINAASDSIHSYVSNLAEHNLISLNKEVMDLELTDMTTLFRTSCDVQVDYAIMSFILTETRHALAAYGVWDYKSDNEEALLTETRIVLSHVLKSRNLQSHLRPVINFIYGDMSTLWLGYTTMSLKGIQETIENIERMLDRIVNDEHILSQEQIDCLRQKKEHAEQLLQQSV